MQRNLKELMNTEFALPKGYRFAGVRAGIKTKAEAKDIALIVSDVETSAAGVYTQNQVVAAPVLNCRSKTPSSRTRAVVVNSGNANACTGSQGADDARRMCEIVAQAGGFSDQQVLVMSTGVIGHFLPMQKVQTGIGSAFSALSDSAQAFLDAADGILTTDQGRKVANASLSIQGKTVQLVGMAKGAGMIGPNMATMLCCVLTDASLSSEDAHRLLHAAANVSFNNISVEGHTSTNDTMLLLANGQADAGPLDSQSEKDFAQALNSLCIELAKQIPADGEGATHLIEVVVRGAASDQDARTISHTIASSNLVKTAIHGNDPNWGRIVSAAGYAGPAIDVHKLQLKLNGILLFDAGEPIEFDRRQASHSIRDHFTTLIEIQVGTGNGTCTHWTSDLTSEYVRFNSEYTT